LTDAQRLDYGGDLGHTDGPVSPPPSTECLIGVFVFQIWRKVYEFANNTGPRILEVKFGELENELGDVAVDGLFRFYSRSHGRYDGRSRWVIEPHENADYCDPVILEKEGFSA
jgi:hypothetical protein